MAIDRAAAARVAKEHAKKNVSPRPSAQWIYGSVTSLVARLGQRLRKAPNLATAGDAARVAPVIQGDRIAAACAPVPSARVGQEARSQQHVPSPSLDHRAAIAAERARCARIVAHGINLGRVEQAGVFAFDTDLDTGTAIAALDAGASSISTHRGLGLAHLMASVRLPNPGAGGESPEPSTAQMIVAAGMKRRGEL